MKQLCRLVFMAAALVGCTPISEADTDPARTTTTSGGFLSFELRAGLACEPSAGVTGCLRQYEAAAAARHGVELSRTSSHFCLAGAAGKACLPEHERLKHAFLERTAGYYVVVETLDHEGFVVRLMDPASGRTYRIDNRPLLSMDGEVFATVSYDIDAGYQPNRVVIWDVATGRLLHQVDGFGFGTGPVGIRWVAPAKLEAVYRLPHDVPEEAPTAVFTIWRGDGNSWTDDYVQSD